SLSLSLSCCLSQSQPLVVSARTRSWAPFLLLDLYPRLRFSLETGCEVSKWCSHLIPFEFPSPKLQDFDNSNPKSHLQLSICKSILISKLTRCFEDLDQII
ncbi:hypothetical protein PanWU01x14_236200, partial [Parasponia andersonii]